MAKKYGYMKKSNEKSTKKSKAIALLFCHFLPLFQFLKKRHKMAKKYGYI
jgi:hypothetical protein